MVISFYRLIQSSSRLAGLNRGADGNQKFFSFFTIFLSSEGWDPLLPSFTGFCFFLLPSGCFTGDRRAPHLHNGSVARERRLFFFFSISFVRNLFDLCFTSHAIFLRFFFYQNQISISFHGFRLPSLTSTI